MKLKTLIIFFIAGIINGVAQSKPNIIVILADDLGYADVGYHGGEEIPTPNIDFLATNGVQFSTGYAMAPVCGPSRAGLLTGRYQNRFGFEDNPGGPFRQTEETKKVIPLSEVTLGEQLKKNGYTTAWIGKDHQEKLEEFHPINRGFDEFFGFVNGASTYFSNKNKKQSLQRGTTPVNDESEYLTDAFGREAVKFIKKNKENPFFLYLPFNAVHGPLEAKKEDLQHFKNIKNVKRRTLAAMHMAMDRNIGNIIETLNTLDLDENTLIFFYSDNGGKPEGNYSYNYPLKGKKGMVLEGGIRVPFLMYWNGTIKGGQKKDFPVAAIDIYPTILSAINSDVKVENELDGIDLMPFLNNEEVVPEDRYIYWRFLYQWAIRNNDWKLLKLKGKQELELYHISEDISETKNVITEFPEIANKLKKEYDVWSDGMMQPQWSWQSKFGGPIDSRKTK